MLLDRHARRPPQNSESFGRIQTRISTSCVVPWQRAPRLVQLDHKLNVGFIACITPDCDRNHMQKTFAYQSSECVRTNGPSASRKAGSRPLRHCTRRIGSTSEPSFLSVAQGDRLERFAPGSATEGCERDFLSLGLRVSKSKETRENRERTAVTVSSHDPVSGS